MRILIDCPENRISKTGGPPGYLYQLKKGLDCLPKKSIEISYLPPSQITAQKKRVPKFVNQLYTNFKLINRLKGTRRLPVDIDEFDAIHFHSTDDLFSARGVLERYSGKVILTQHSPCASYLEKKEILSPLILRLCPRILQKFEAADLYSFQRADLVIFPCKEAEEPYFNTWDCYAQIRDGSKIGYLPTGTERAVAKVTRKEIREKYGIPETALLFSYVGRHNQIKGYDLLIKAFSEYLRQNKNAWILCAGSPGPVESPKLERWIEAGWTNDPHSLVAASDAFVLPNRQTYFDLVMLEVLSLGMPVIASCTGGNKYFKRFGDSGIMLFESVDELISQLVRFEKMDESTRILLGEANKRIYARNFTETEFAENYISLLKQRL